MLGIHVRISILKMHDTLCARAPRTCSLAVTGDIKVNYLVLALDDALGNEFKADRDVKNCHQTILGIFRTLALQNQED